MTKHDDDKTSEKKTENNPKTNTTNIEIDVKSTGAFAFITPENVIPIVIIGGFVLNTLVNTTLGQLLSPITAVITTAGDIAEQTIAGGVEIITGAEELAVTGIEQVTDIIKTAEESATEVITTAEQGIVDIFTTGEREIGETLRVFAEQPAAVAEAIFGGGDGGGPLGGLTGGLLGGIGAVTDILGGKAPAGSSGGIIGGISGVAGEVGGFAEDVGKSIGDIFGF